MVSLAHSVVTSRCKSIPKAQKAIRLTSAIGSHTEPFAHWVARIANKENVTFSCHIGFQSQLLKSVD